jgi:ectoine hydroxylase-related dioxygenase (phytanoyl-CoA dioxygenase family)
MTAFCGILYLSDNGPGTFFKDFDVTIEEKIGRYVLFHPLLLHSVEKNLKNKERITIAFNMYETKVWDKDKQIKWVNR